jgi:hypothetical protein
VQSRLLPRRYWGDRPGGLYAETVVHETLALLGGLYWPWSLLGEDRYAPDPGVVWHCSHAPEDYHRVAAELGVRLESGFHTWGWQAELATGGYSYG